MPARAPSLASDRFSFAWNGVSVRLPALEWKVARCLAQAAGTVVSKERIAQELWGDHMADPGRAVDAHIYRLRRRLAGIPGVHIDTVRQRGFRMHLAV